MKQCYDGINSKVETQNPLHQHFVLSLTIRVYILVCIFFPLRTEPKRERKIQENLFLSFSVIRRLKRKFIDIKQNLIIYLSHPYRKSTSSSFTHSFSLILTLTHFFFAFYFIFSLFLRSLTFTLWVHVPYSQSS